MQICLRVAVIFVVLLSVGSIVRAQDSSQTVESTPLTADALQQLVAPIALYPDSLVAQILAASTYPTQIVEADRWVQEHSNLKDEELADEVDKQSWDPSIKALTPFPSVLANLDTNLSWTSALGDAYFNQQQDVLDAIQVLRARAQAAGNLQSNPQQTVASQGTNITIEPADPNICYVPIYDPLIVYGAPIGIYPGYLYNSVVGRPYISFGLGIRIGGGFWGGLGWGFHSWGCNWGGRRVTFNHDIYVSHSPIFFNRYGGGPGFRGGVNRPFIRDPTLPPGVRNSDPTRPPGTFPNRGFGQPGRFDNGMRSGAFSGIGPGGTERGFGDRGRQSFGGGGVRGGGRH
jgi:hypothetical protein